jgi:hypothetical protein
MELQRGDILIGLADAAARLGVASSTLRRQVEQGILSGVLIGRSWVTTEREIERYRSEHLGKVGAKQGNLRITAVPLDETQLGYFIREVELQCSIALHAYHMIYASMGIPEQDDSTEERERAMHKQVEGTMAYCHMMLSHAGNVSKLLWPSRPFRRDYPTEMEYKQREKDQKKRGQQLRAALGVPDHAPLKSRIVRDHLEHYDERLEAYLRRPRRNGLIDMAFVMWKQPGVDYHRLFNPAGMVFTFEDASVGLIVLANLLREVRSAAREWLYATDAWSRNDPDAWYNEDDYTLGMRDYFFADEWAWLKERRKEHRAHDPIAIALAALEAVEDDPAIE